MNLMLRTLLENENNTYGDEMEEEEKESVKEKLKEINRRHSKNSVLEVLKNFRENEKEFMIRYVFF